VDADPEHAGQDRGGELGGEGEQGCRAALAGMQADVPQPVSEAPAVEGMAGPAAGEQPGDACRASDGGVAGPGGG
jgi:hypothetical protein